MKANYRLSLDLGLDFSSGVMVGEKWLNKVSQYFDQHYLDPAETKCECTTDADCDVSKGEKCGPDGGCLVPQTNSLGMQSYAVQACPIFTIQAEVGQCCGDGVVQSTPV